MEVQKRVELAAEIFEKHGATIRAFINHHVNGSTEADDIYQTLFLSLVRRPVPLHVQNVVGYLYRAIQNDAIDAARRRKSYQDLISRYADDPMHNTVQEDVQSMVIEAEDAQRTVQTIKRHLRHHEAQAIIERYGCNHNSHDVTETTRIKKRTLSRYVCTGLKKLRQIIQEGEGGMDAFLASHSSLTSTNRVRSLHEGESFSGQPTYV
jgi:RNA polymerase sigma factor (sigma-70 family)